MLNLFHISGKAEVDNEILKQVQDDLGIKDTTQKEMRYRAVLARK